MSVNLPHWLAEIGDILGFSWPEIDEDQMREARGMELALDAVTGMKGKLIARAEESQRAGLNPSSRLEGLQFLTAG